jgi:hypothetical protein
MDAEDKSMAADEGADEGSDERGMTLFRALRRQMDRGDDQEAYDTLKELIHHCQDSEEY